MNSKINPAPSASGGDIVKYVIAALLVLGGLFVWFWFSAPERAVALGTWAPQLRGLAVALAAQDTVEAQSSALEAISRQLEQADKRFEVGLIAITDVQEARAARDSAAAAVIAAKRALASAQEQLREITGEKYATLAKPGAAMPLHTPDPADEDQWVALSMEQNLALISSRLAADSRMGADTATAM